VLQIVLVFRFGLPEITDRFDLGHDLARPDAGRIDVGDGAQRLVALRFAGPVDGRAVGRPAVVALAVRRARVVDLEEELQQPAVTQHRRVEQDLDRLGVRAVIAVGRVRHVAAAVTDAGRDHARNAADQLLHAPETTAGEHCAFAAHRTSST
jgi:hypothetical protein